MSDYKKSIRQLFSSIIVLWAACSFTVTYAQSDISAAVTNQFNNYQQNNLQEKIFIHTDRSFYVAGEIIWFKAYCADASTNHLSALSKVAYIEVLDKDKQPVLQAKIALKDGTGSGSFVIPVNIHSGNFLLRSYTNWMKNFDPEFYYHQNLTIINTVKAEAGTTDKAVNKYDVQFFPEGGNLVNELKSKVAFRATDNRGKGIDFNGAIIDQDNDTMVRFRPARFGIGNFNFTPQKGRQYKALLTTKNGTIITQHLPQPLNTGFVINVSQTPGQDAVKINIHTTASDKFAFLVIHSHQQIKTTQLLPIQNGNADFQTDINSFEDGLSSITIFNENKQPVCERLFFKKPGQQLVINAVTGNVQYGTRKKVTVNVVSEDEGARPAASDMSMAVFLLDSLPVTHQNINNYLWMNSELKGIIESPEYYFNNSGAEVNEATDNLMLTHGWRRFKWEDVLENKKPLFKFLPEYEGHIVSGKIVNKSNEKPGQRIPGFLSVPGPLFQLYTAKSSLDGSIYFNTRNFYGQRLIVGQTENLEADSFRLDISSPFSEDFASSLLPSFNNSQALSAMVLKRSINMQVQNVYAGERLNSLEKPPADTANFYGKPDVMYKLDNYTRFATMEEVLREYVREVNVRKRRDNFVLTNVTKDENGNSIIKEPVVLLDGVPQFDSGNKITHYDPLKVQKLEVIQDKYFLGPVSFDGIVSFSTYNGDLEGFRLDTASTVMDYDALQIKREFYSPVYQTTQEYSSRLPDFRSLLYWSPDIKTDNTGKKEISFYTSDVPGKYAVVVQGISKQGKAGSKVFTIEVRK